jgi:hypothetical protein
MVQGCGLGGGLLQAAQAAHHPQGQLRGRHQELRRLSRDRLAQGAASHRPRAENVRGFLESLPRTEQTRTRS